MRWCDSSIFLLCSNIAFTFWIFFNVFTLSFLLWPWNSICSTLCFRASHSLCLRFPPDLSVSFMSGLLISNSLLKLSTVIFWYSVRSSSNPNLFLDCYCFFWHSFSFSQLNQYFSSLESVAFNKGSLILAATTTFVVNFLLHKGFLNLFLSRYNSISLYYQCQTGHDLFSYQCQTRTQSRKLLLPNTGHDLDYTINAKPIFTR